MDFIDFKLGLRKSGFGYKNFGILRVVIRSYLFKNIKRICIYNGCFVFKLLFRRDYDGYLLGL